MLWLTSLMNLYIFGNDFVSLSHLSLQYSILEKVDYIHSNDDMHKCIHPVLSNVIIK